MKQLTFNKSSEQSSFFMFFSGLVLLVAWCGCSTPSSPSEPTQHNDSTATILKVIMDATTCYGKASSISVSADGQYIGTIQPGDAGISTSVVAGTHTVTATSQEGTKWVSTVVVPYGKIWTTTLGCKDVSPILATFTITIDGNCTGINSNIAIYIDGGYVGTAQPGGSGVSEQVTIGDHQVYAKSQEGGEWKTFTQPVPANGWTTRLACH